MNATAESIILNLIPVAFIGGAFVLTAIVTEVYGRIEAKRKGIKFKSIF
jgi:hypothetical protein